MTISELEVYRRIFFCLLSVEFDVARVTGIISQLALRKLVL